MSAAAIAAEVILAATAAALLWGAYVLRPLAKLVRLWEVCG